jgi:hypothetical protein
MDVFPEILRALTTGKGRELGERILKGGPIQRRRPSYHRAEIERQS